ncbi:MAG TPA: homoserine kinase [Syntrophomonadaceae bacterium]|nr:homoserine kinase [Syntrophomonadaceae bacterium]
MVMVKVPASSANLGPGFDTLGLALNLCCTLEIQESTTGGSFETLGKGMEHIPPDPGENLIIRAMRQVFDREHCSMPEMDIRVNSQIPMARGLGSSAAAVVAGLCAADALLGSKMTKTQLLELALSLEGHADNVVPALLGGLNSVMIYQGRVYYQRIPVPADLQVVAVVPDYFLPTEQARAVLPNEVSLADTVSNLQRACFLVAGFFNGDLTHLDKAMDDMVYQPRRKHMIPGFDQVLSAARQAGALGAALSGAGPSILAFCKENGQKVGEAMQQGFAAVGMKSDIYILQPNFEGAVIV